MAPRLQHGPMTGVLAVRAAGVDPGTPVDTLSPDAIQIGHERANVVRDYGITNPDLLEEARRYCVPIEFDRPVTGTDDERAAEVQRREALIRAAIARAKAVQAEARAAFPTPPPRSWLPDITFERAIILFLMAVIALLVAVVAILLRYR